MNINKVMILGNVVADPIIRITPNSVQVGEFTVATSGFKPATEGKEEVVEYHRVVVWRKLADLAKQHLTKGRQVYVEGSLETRSWEKDGEKRYRTQITADNFIAL